MHSFSRFPLGLLSLLLVLGACVPRGGGGDDDDSAGDDDDSGDPGLSGDRVSVLTSAGEFEIQLYLEEAPGTTENFLRYVDDGFFDGDDGLGATTFHRVVADFVIQGGGRTVDGTLKETLPPIANEASSSGLSNVRGTLSMARTNAPDSATSQFFVNLVDNQFLDPGEATPDGYAVFGEVTSGMDVVDAIGGVATDPASDAPLEPVLIEDVERLELSD